MSPLKMLKLRVELWLLAWQLWWPHMVTTFKLSILLFFHLK